MNINLNPGGFLGALACGGLAVVIALALERESRGIAQFLIGGAILGALGGNFLWAAVFPKRPRSDDDEDDDDAENEDDRPRRQRTDMKKAGKRESGEPIITALLLEDETFPVNDFLKQAAKTRFAGKSAKEIDPGKDGVFSFQVGAELLVLAHMPVPYPAQDLEGPIATTWMWPARPPVKSVKQHRSHLLITMTGGAANPVRRRLIMTAVTALAARQPGVMAVYWGDAALVIHPPLFVKMAAEIDSPEAPPLYLWVDLRAFRNKDGTTGLFTAGLSALGHMEIEIPSIDMEPGDLREWLLNIMYYLLDKGPVLKHGETIGMTAEQKIGIRHCASRFGHPGKVICLEP